MGVKGSRSSDHVLRGVVPLPVQAAAQLGVELRQGRLHAAHPLIHRGVALHQRRVVDRRHAGLPVAVVCKLG